MNIKMIITVPILVFPLSIAYGSESDYHWALSDHISSTDQDTNYYNNRGTAFSSKGDYDRAISDYTKAIELDPKNSDAYYNRGNTYVMKGNFDLAISDFTRAIELDPKNSDAYNNRGNAYRSKGDNNLARSDFTRANELKQVHTENNSGNAQRVPQHLEEKYRLKFKNDVANGDTIFFNSDNKQLQFGAFLRRFENALYGVWSYPDEAALKGIGGIVPVRITFNRNGEIVNAELLESSGAQILDNEILRMLHAIGQIGAFPKGYDKEQLHLIVFFQYNRKSNKE